MVWDSQYLSWGECYSSPKNTYLRRSNMKRVQPVRHTRWHKHKAPLLQHLIGRINVCKMIKISVLILSALWLESSEKILCLLRVFCLSKLIWWCQKLVCTWVHFSDECPGGLLPMMAYMGRLHPKGVPFFRTRVYKRVGTSLVEVYKRVGKSVIWVCKRAQKG